MRAVNLIPGDRGPGRHSSSAQMAGPVYILLAGLGVLVIFVLLWTVADRQIAADTAKLAGISAEAQAAEQRAQASAPYLEFVTLARSRKATISSLSATRFDWAHALREVARVLPGDVWLTTIDGSSGAAGGAPEPTTSAAPAPRFDIQGCTGSQADVARLMARLRAVDGVRSVELKTSVKPDASGGEDCPANRPSDPAFTIAIGFGVPGQPKASVDSTGQAGASAPSAAPAGPGGSAAPAAPPAAAPPTAAAPKDQAR